MTTIKKAVWILVAIIILTVTIAVVYTFRKPATSVGRAKVEEYTSASMMYTNFEENEEQANLTYVGKIVQVDGTVIRAVKNKDNTVSVTLESGNMMGSVICNFSPKEIQVVDNIIPGRGIIIKGSCSGFLMDVILEKCTIVQK